MTADKIFSRFGSKCLQNSDYLVPKQSAHNRYLQSNALFF